MDELEDEKDKPQPPLWLLTVAPLLTWSAAVLGSLYVGAWTLHVPWILALIVVYVTEFLSAAYVTSQLRKLQIDFAAWK